MFRISHVNNITTANVAIKGVTINGWLRIYTICISHIDEFVNSGTTAIDAITTSYINGDYYYQIEINGS